eukprot:CAMPEP_0178900066 /NCGR_PEP_ID=MMETSP0786-20121207/3264_1 /TAXON_ID=186022 /ORGANISM="Thalassionema frauenfeldii, Strain CCMP 1798" /LENGTH=1038 /DNA_ID=CAMNT_0020571023 /DNA_START=121 /DNA_END=3237 /DNA_ORIENTATION=-
MTVEATLKEMQLKEDLPSSGLSKEEADQRLEQFGPNKMTEGKKKTLLERIWDQVANLLVLLLVIIAVVAAFAAVAASARDDPQGVLTNCIQVGLIAMVITVNTIIGVVQEGSAEKAAEALKGMLSADALVLREGKEVQIPSVEVVPGDIIILGTGDKVPADCRFTSVSNIACGEAALTGESVPIDKTTDAIEVEGNPEQTPLGDRHNMAFSATLVAQGSGRAIVVATGDNTQIGTINALVSTVEEKKTNVLEQIDHISKILAALILTASTCTFLVAFFLNRKDYDAFDAVLVALVCAVGMIPEGLEAIVTMTYAWAVSNMASHNAIIRALPAVETLGSVTVICSDKTGTLTQNKMSVVAFVTSNAHYRVDVNATDRVNTNFVRDDSYLAERADHQANKSAGAVVADGPNSAVPRRGRAEASNHMAIENLENPAPSAHGDAGGEDADYPFANGDSPSFEFIKGGLIAGVLCSHCVLGTDGGREGEIGNPTEISILRAAYMAGIDVEGIKEKNSIVAEVPFSSAYKFMSTVHEPIPEIDGPGLEDSWVVYVKGAPDRMLALCNTQMKGGVIGEVEEVRKTKWTEQIATLSSHGLRVLALCKAIIPKSEVSAGDQLGPEFINERPQKEWLSMVGLCAIQDPPRPECIDAITEAHGAGVRVAMITGDHKDTAIAIGSTLGLVDEKYPSGITGPELDAMNEEELMEAVQKYNIFARSSPENKLQIVKALQAQKEISSMTGDGVNDAPSLKQADMGVAMGLEGTDVAREASDMILADDNFATIVYAVREGRVVWDNLRKVLLVNTPINNAQGMSVLFGLLFGLGQPLNAIQILYSNLICAVTLGFVTAIEPAEEGIMELPPRRVGKRLIGRYLLLRILLGTATLITMVCLSVLWVEKVVSDDLQVKQSIAFNTLDLCAISICLSARFAYNSSLHPRLLTGNKGCWYSVALVIILQIMITYIPKLNDLIFSMAPMTGAMWGISIVGMVITFIVMEVEKAVRRYLKAKGSDTDDRELDGFDRGDTRTSHMHLPANAHKLGTAELRS